jgi:hypothetical protein
MGLIPLVKISQSSQKSAIRTVQKKNRRSRPHTVPAFLHLTHRLISTPRRPRARTVDPQTNQRLTASTPVPSSHQRQSQPPPSSASSRSSFVRANHTSSYRHHQQQPSRAFSGALPATTTILVRLPTPVLYFSGSSQRAGAQRSTT